MSLALPLTLAGRYVLTQRLGFGSYAETFAATDRHTQRVVAVKLLREEFGADPDVAARFQREAATGAALRHPYVVAVLDHGRADGRLFTVMELVEGGNLKEFVDARAPLSVAEALALIQGVLRGLEAIHQQGIVHRDIKPENILLDRHGTPKLSDFGIARATHGSEFTASGLTLGTAAYMAPEQALGEPVGPAADLYAAGVILYELLTGQVPFPGDDPLQVMYRQVHETPVPPRLLNPAVPPALSAAVMRALAKDPRGRFAGARDMWRALIRGWNEAPSPAATATRTLAVRPLARTRPVDRHAGRQLVGLAAAVALLVLGALGFSSLQLGTQTLPGPAPTTVPTTAPSYVASNQPLTPTPMPTLPPVGAPPPVALPPAMLPHPLTLTPTQEPAVTPAPTPVPLVGSGTELASQPIESTSPVVRSDAPDSDPSATPATAKIPPGQAKKAEGNPRDHGQPGTQSGPHANPAPSKSIGHGNSQGKAKDKGKDNDNGHK